MPDMISHYVAEHAFRPPQEFVDDVLSGDVLETRRAQTKAPPQRVGYLHGEYPKWTEEEASLANKFLAELLPLLRWARRNGEHVQYRSI
jgi:hypothetical protein